MESKNQILLLVSLSSLLFSLCAADAMPRNSISIPPTPSQAVDPGLKKICEATHYPRLCLSSINPIFDGKSDPLSIFKLAVNVSIEHTTLAKKEFSEIRWNPSTPASIAELYEQCYDLYMDSYDSFLEAIVEMVERNDIKLSKTRLQQTVFDFSSCYSYFSSKNGGVVPFAKSDAKLKRLAKNCIAIANLIH